MYNNVQNIILNCAMVVVTLWIVDRFWYSFFERKKKNALILFTWFFFGIYQIYFESNSGEIHIIATILNVGLFLIISVVGYRSDGKAKYFLLMLFYSVWSLIEVFVYFFMESALNGKGTSDRMGAVISKILMIIFVHELSVARKNKKDGVIPSRYYTFLLFNIVVLEIYTKLSDIYIAENERTVYAQQIDIISKNTIAQEKMLEDFHAERHNLLF